MQSLFCLQSRTICWPVQLEPSVVGQLLPDVQLTLTAPLVQLGTDPPVSGIVPQQTCPPLPQSEVLAHAKPASFDVDPELEPLPELPPELLVPPELPELLPEPDPEPLLPVPELLPLTEPLELPEPDPLDAPEPDPLLPPELTVEGSPELWSPPLLPPEPPGSPPPEGLPEHAATMKPPASTKKAVRMISSFACPCAGSVPRGIPRARGATACIPRFSSGLWGHRRRAGSRTTATRVSPADR